VVYEFSTEMGHSINLKEITELTTIYYRI